MSSRPGFNRTDMLLALLGGAAVGAAVALLTAPATGAKTRANIGKYLRNGRERASDYVENGKERIGEYVEVGKDKARAIPGAVKSAGGAAREALTEAMREA